MSVRYIGSKARVSGLIADLTGPPPSDAGVFVDGFSGTGAVASAVADLGWPVRINDHLTSSAITSAARLISRSAVPFASFGGYENALAELSGVEPVLGFIAREYSPVSAQHAEVERRYFTEANASRIDAMRARITTWHEDGTISATEERLLIADLLAAANRVANIAGTYGCFLRDWSSTGLRELELQPRTLRSRPVEMDVHVGDVTQIPVRPEDVVYFDPPYTKRQYAAYYHILETIALGDEPEVGGVTGLRPWRHLASDFCYRKRALTALTSLVRNCTAGRVLLSYSSEGHVSQDELEAALAPLGKLTVHSLGEIGRYRPNDAAVRNADSVREYVFELRRPTQGVAVQPSLPLAVQGVA
ncbi:MULTISPECIES: DNA adenine methylase [Streptomyces]|uniref:DNA adenine methylase n=1 Tax=Streptomyces TaxID=1883 RepID=UPI00109E6FD9|nr:DNA adenine methylase [Streptomyces sp. LRa12]THA88984.1 DNA methyltransferase [Streptomyces sp. LRa12]WST54907.1 DNA adenine methylase [Streptomyces rubiginosohelvolus]